MFKKLTPSNQHSRTTTTMARVEYRMSWFMDKSLPPAVYLLSTVMAVVFHKDNAINRQISTTANPTAHRKEGVLRFVVTVTLESG